MIAARDLKYAARVGKDAFLDILDPGPVHAHRHLILGFTRDRAGVTSDAPAVIDDEAVFHRRKSRPETVIILRMGRSFVGSRLKFVNHKGHEDSRRLNPLRVSLVDLRVLSG